MDEEPKVRTVSTNAADTAPLTLPGGAVRAGGYLRYGVDARPSSKPPQFEKLPASLLGARAG